MKAQVFSIEGQKKGEVNLPQQFEEAIRFDLIKRAVLAQQSNSFQPHGVDPMAGKRQGHPTPKRRKKYKTSYGHGMSRIARKYSWHRGMQFSYVGAFVANAVKGLKAFPPLAEKVITEEINKKERRKAIRSAIAASASIDLVKQRGHRVDKVPIIVENRMESLKKAKNVQELLNKLGLGKEMERVEEKKVRAGKGKMRGRRYKCKVGPLIVVSKSCDIMKAARNLPGVEVIAVKDLNAEALAPGAHPGRLCIWSDSAVERLGGLFK